MTVDLDKLERLARAATPGPWRWGDISKQRSNGISERIMCLYSGDRRTLPVLTLNPGSGWITLGDDADHVAAASPDVVLELVAEARAGRSLLDVANRLADAAEEYTRRHTFSTMERVWDGVRELRAALGRPPLPEDEVKP